MNKKKWRLLFIISCILLSSCFGRDCPVRLRSSFSTPLHDGMEMNLELSGLGAQEPKNLLNFPSSQNLKRQTTQVLKNTAAALAQELKFAPVELILQNPELPNGCEVTSLAMLLTSAGFPVDHVKLYQQYLPTKEFTYSKNQRLGPSPNEFYVGDASSRTGGWYCFESPIIEAGNAWIQANGGGGRMLSLTGISQSELDQYARDETPVAVWVTMDHMPPVYTDSFSWILPSGERYIPYNNLHCVVLAGEEGEQYRIADPMNGWQLVDKDVFWSSFDAMGLRAVTVGTEPFHNANLCRIHHVGSL